MKEVEIYTENFVDWCITNGFKPIKKNGVVRWKNREYAMGYLSTDILLRKHREYYRLRGLKNLLPKVK